MSAKGQQRTSVFFDHLVGAGEEPRRNFRAEICTAIGHVRFTTESGHRLSQAFGARLLLGADLAAYIYQRRLEVRETIGRANSFRDKPVCFAS